MIYPTIHFHNNQISTIYIYDSDFGIEPVMSISDNSKHPMDTFYSLLSLFINQYISGYNDGYEVGFDDAETEGDISYGEYDE